MLQVKGLKKLEDKFKSMKQLELAKKIIHVNAGELEKKMVDNAVFMGHYENGKFTPPTGTTKRSIQTAITEGGLKSNTQPTTDYASYPEYGTRYSPTQSFVRPAFNAQKEKFKDDMDKLVR